MSYSRLLNPPVKRIQGNKKMWGQMDSNHRRHSPADLQSAPFGRSGISPSFVLSV